MSAIENFSIHYGLYDDDPELFEVIEKAMERIGFYWDGDGCTGEPGQTRYSRFKRKEKEVDITDEVKLVYKGKIDHKLDTRLINAMSGLGLNFRASSYSGPSATRRLVFDRKDNGG